MEDFLSFLKPVSEMGLCIVLLSYKVFRQDRLMQKLLEETLRTQEEIKIVKGELQSEIRANRQEVEKNRIEIELISRLIHAPGGICR